MKRKFTLAVAALAASVLMPVTAGALANAQAQAPVQSSTLSGAILSAQVAEGDNDFKATIDYYRQALGFDPGNKQFEQNLMIALLTDGQFDEALPYAEKLKTVPEIERVSRVALAIDSIRKKDWAEAENLLKLALQSDLDRLITGLMTGWVKLGAGDGKEGAAQIAALKGPEWYDLFKAIHKALVLDGSGDKAAALEAYEAAASSTDAASAPDAWLRLIESFARFHAKDGKTKEALAVIERGFEIAPERPSLLALKKDIEAGKPVTAMLADAQMGAAEVLFGLGSAVRRDGSEGFALMYLQLALAADPASDVTLIQLAGVAENQERQGEAIAFYDKIAPGSAFRRGADLQSGLNLADLDKKDDAVKVLTALIDKEPADTRAYLALGGVHATAKDYKSAADVYERAVKSIGKPDRADWNLFYQRGIANERTKNWDVAEASFKEALKLYPDQPQVLNYLGYSWVDMNKNLDEALGMIRKAVEIRPDDGYIVDSLGWAYYRLGRFDEAASELEKAISLRPEDATINDHLGDAYWRVGRKLEARFQWQHALDAKSDDVDNGKIKAKLAATEPVVAEAISDKKG
ncbi:MAG: tetratricopeptide repeat protein [Rhizobiaceae bacterium]